MSEQNAKAGEEAKTEKKPKSHKIDREHKKSKWTIERCSKVARRFASLEEWETGAPSSFKAASAHDWVAKCAAHMRGGVAKKGQKRVS